MFDCVACFAKYIFTPKPVMRTLYASCSLGKFDIFIYAKCFLIYILDFVQGEKKSSFIMSEYCTRTEGGNGKLHSCK